jgi:hypothetical protein
MTNAWFDIEAMRQVCKEQGNLLKLCHRKVVQLAQPQYNLPEQVNWVCTPVMGYAYQQRFSAIATSVKTVEDKDWNICLIPGPDFNESMITPETMIEFQGVKYYLEMKDIIISRGQKILYKYLIKNEAPTIVALK